MATAMTTVMPYAMSVSRDDTSNQNITAQLHEALSSHIGSHFRTDRWMQDAFQRDGYLKVSHLIPDLVKQRVTQETFHLLDKLAKRRDLHIPATGNTPRFLSNVRQEDIAQHGTVIPAVYHSQPLLDWLSVMAQEEVIANPWEFEKFIINRQEKAGDTHGWHWGDYPYSLIWIIDAPDPSYGGLLQTVPHTRWNKTNPAVHEHLIRNPIRTKAHATGDVYLLKSDTTLHRVTPLVKTPPRPRVIINMAWERAKDKDRTVSHETFAFRD